MASAPALPYIAADMTELDLTPRLILFALAGAALLIGGVAAFAEHRRVKRRDLDRVGLIPWNFIQVIPLLTVLAAAGVALKL